MAEASEPRVSVLSVRLEQRTYPAYDPFHGTNAPMLWRQVTITLPEGAAVFEQTDYGHPGRLNPWEHRGLPPALLSKATRLMAVAEAVGELMA
jgi:hypothetical protein